jgi:hypothetical protein
MGIRLAPLRNSASITPRRPSWGFADVICPNAPQSCSFQLQPLSHRHTLAILADSENTESEYHYGVMNRGNPLSAQDFR